MKLDENGDMCLPCHARRYVLERLGFEDHERIETRSAKLRTIHGHTFVIQVFNSVFQTEFGCPKWEDLCKAYGFQKGMEITFDLCPEDNMPDNIDIWVVVDDMLPVLPPCEFLNHICQVICIYIYKQLVQSTCFPLAIYMSCGVHRLLKLWPHVAGSQLLGHSYNYIMLHVVQTTTTTQIVL